MIGKICGLKLIWMNKFIRISNSCIININHVECFNTGIVGTIMVKFKDGKIEYDKVLKEPNYIKNDNYC